MEHVRGTWLIAVSGGPDSMALFHMCLEEGISFAAAHVNYHHRPQADAEEAWVREFSAAHGITCHVRNEPFVWQGNFEAAARSWRYSFFRELCEQNGYAGVMTAHHQDDLLETYFMQEEKGIVPDFWGIREDLMMEGVRVKRPLLGYTKRELEAVCRENGIRFFIDETNGDTALTRNRIRRETVSKLSEFERTMVLREMEQRNAVLSEQRCRVRTMMRNGAVEADRYRHLAEEDRLTLLRLELKEILPRASRAFLKEIDHIICTRRDFVIPCGTRLLVSRDGCFFLIEPPVPYRTEVSEPQELFRLVSPYFRIGPGVPGVNAVTLQEGDFPLTIRSPLPGDAIRMRFGTKTVHRFFVDRRIPLFERPVWPVVTNVEGTVILVPGLGCEPGHYSISPDLSVVQYFAYGKKE